MSPFAVLSQSTFRGIVVDAATGNALPYATLKLKHKTQGAYCNEYGQFAILANQSDTLMVSYIGYKSNEILLNAVDTIKLKSLPRVLDEVVIRPEALKKVRQGVVTKKSDIWVGARIALEYAVKIEFQDTVKEYFLNKVFFNAKGKPAQGQSIQLHIYEATKEGPGKELLPEVFLIKNLSITRKGIDVSAFNITCRGSIFVGIEYVGHVEKEVRTSAFFASMLVPESNDYIRTILSLDNRWYPMNFKNSKGAGPLKIVASVEVE